MASDSRALGMPRVAIAIAVVAWGIAAVAAGLVAVARPEITIDFWFFTVDVMVAVVYGTVAAVTLSRRIHPVPLILAVTAVGGGLAAFGYGWASLLNRHPGISDATWIGTLSNLAWVPGTMALFLVIPWLVRDHRLSWEWIGVVTGFAVVAGLMWERIAFDGAWDRALFTVSVGFGLVTAVVVGLRRMFGPVEERLGLGWLATGTVMMALSFVPLTLPIYAGADDAPMVNVFSDRVDFLDVLAFTPALHLAAQALFPAAILAAVLRGRMWGLDLAISRATLTGLLTLALVLVYLLVTLVVDQIVPGEGLAHLVGAGAVAVAVQPARLWFAARVDRLVYGDAAADPARLVRQLGSRLGVVADTDELFAGLARDLGTAMRLESVAVRGPGVETRWGRPTSEPTVVPLLHQGTEVGSIEVTAPAGESLGARGAKLVADFGAVAAVALAVRQQAAQVEEARVRLTRARLEERRVIRREIHDGLGPSLAGVRLGLQGARNLLGRDDAAAARILEELQADLDRQVADVRTLSHNLLPPVLDELGLAAALEELAGRHREAGQAVATTVEVPDGLPASVSAAAYAVASEALINAAKHSGAHQCWLEAAVESGGLTVRVIDNGRGIATDATSGVGTMSMRERAQELGGSVTIELRAGGGTVVHMEVPL